MLIGGKLTAMTIRTQIPGTRQFHLAQGGENATRAQLPVTCLVTARARDAALFRRRLGKLQQLRERRRTGLMQGGADGHLHRFQIQAAGLLSFGKNAAQ